MSWLSGKNGIAQIPEKTILRFIDKLRWQKCQRDCWYMTRNALGRVEIPQEAVFHMEGSTMLVLSRKLGEQIVIGEHIRVTVLELNGGRVKLGFAGPAEVPIHRKELSRKLGDREQVTGNREEEKGVRNAGRRTETRPLTRTACHL
jgi:carbon storage regulator